MASKEDQQRAALERLIDLALFLAARPDRPIPGAVIKAEVYDALLAEPQTDSAFHRMFDRDRKQLEAAGLRITAEPDGTYAFDPAQNYTADLNLTPAERAAAALAATALADDPLFPMPVALSLALVKMSRVLDKEGALLERDPGGGETDGAMDTPVARWTEMILHAQLEGCCLDLRYRDQRGQRTARRVAPYGLFLLSGQWYLAGADSLRDDIRVFAVARIEDLQTCEESFCLPDDFSVERWRQLPFRLSSAPRDRVASVVIPAARAREAADITRGKGTVEPADDGSLRWKIPYPSGQQDRLIRYALEQGLSFGAASPEEQAALRQALEEVLRAHA